MPVFEKNDRRLLFIHIPKAGGTTVEEVFVANGYRMRFRRGGRYGPLTPEDRERGCSPQHMHASLLENQFDPDTFDEIFTLVRHPLDRFISEYKFQLAGGRQVPDFRTWMERVPAKFRQNPFIHDNHLRPQNEFIWTRRCRIFKLEDGLEPLFSALSASGEAIQYDGEAWIRLCHEDAGVWREIAYNFVQDFYEGDFQMLGYS